MMVNALNYAYMVSWGDFEKFIINKSGKIKVLEKTLIQ